MAKMYDGEVPFDEDGNQLRYAGPYRPVDVVWQPNDSFHSTLEFVKFNRGRSAAYASFEDADGKRRYMFLKDLDEVLRNGWFRGAKLTGTFTYCKRGQNYGVRMIARWEDAKILPGEFCIGKLGPQQSFVFADDSTIAARIDDDGSVRLAKETVATILETVEDD